MRKAWKALLMLALMASLVLTGCGQKPQEKPQQTEEKKETEPAKTETEPAKEETKAPEKVKIGVVIYNENDPEVMAFRHYYEDYIASSFEAEFYYSGSVQSLDAELSFIADAKAQGAKGIISFTSQDLEAVVSECEKQELYYVRGSGSVSDEAFGKVKDSAYFLGTIGPGEDMEKEAGKDMAEYFMAKTLIEQGKGNGSYLVLSGGATSGNVMHQYRTEAVLEALGADPALAMSDSFVVVETERGKVGLCPGLLRLPETQEMVKSILDSGEYNAILSSLPGIQIYDMIKDAKKSTGVDIQFAAIDCFTEENMNAVNDGILSYITGKYPSEIGPAFALMHNAISGFAADFREADGSAVRIEQGFWTAANDKTYRELYDLTAGVYVNAYSMNDLIGIMKAYTPDTTLKAFEELTESYSVADVAKRRSAQ